MESRHFCKLDVYTKALESKEASIRIKKEEEEEEEEGIGVELAFKVVERQSCVACSLDGASTTVVDQIETVRPWRVFDTSIPHPWSLQLFDEFVHRVILLLGIPNEYAFRIRVQIIAHVDNKHTREAMEREFKHLAIVVLIELDTWYVLRFGAVPASGFGAVPATETAMASALSGKTFKKEMEGSQETCVICLEEFVEYTQVNQLPCLHIFHEECVKNWLRQSSFCPICRFRIQD